MDKQEIIDSPSGTIITTIKNQSAFIPNPLPPVIDYPAIISLQERAAIAIGELNKAGNQLDNPYLVIRPLQRQEALLSSSMEGTYTTASALVLADADEDKYVDAAALEVRNYIRAFNYAEAELNNIPLSNRLIKGCTKHFFKIFHKGVALICALANLKILRTLLEDKGEILKKRDLFPLPLRRQLKLWGY